MFKNLKTFQNLLKIKKIHKHLFFHLLMKLSITNTKIKDMLIDKGLAVFMYKEVIF